MGKGTKKRAIKAVEQSNDDAVARKKKRVSWAEKLERFQGEEEEEVVVKISTPAKPAIQLPKTVKKAEEFELSSEDDEEVENVPTLVEAENSSDLPVDKIEDAEMESSSEDEAEETYVHESQIAASPVKNDENSKVVVPKKVKPVKEKKEYKKFDYKTAVERTLFVGNVPYSTKALSLKKLFTPYGKIEAIYKRSLLQKTEKLTKKMFGTDKELKTVVTDAHIYVRFETEESAKKACELNGTEFKGRNLRVTLSTDKSTDPTRSLFVGNLSYNLSEQSLMEFFEEKAGEVESVRIVHDKDSGLGKGYGFVTFKKAEQVRKALDVLQGQRFKGRPIRLTKMAKKKNRAVAGPLKTKGRMQNIQKQRGERELQSKLANYTVTKKTFSKINSDENKFSKTAIKSMKKRKQSKLKKKSLLS